MKQIELQLNWSAVVFFALGYAIPAASLLAAEPARRPNIV